jgi:hypothetical protein
MAIDCARARVCAPYLFILSLLACESDPSRTSIGDQQFRGTIDPSVASVALHKLVGSNQLAVELIASGEVRIDPQTQRVAIDVGLRNAGAESLMAPILIRLGEFQPAGVIPFNSDWPRLDALKASELEYPWGYFYADEFSSDQLLEPGETSALREWVFFDPDLASFSFAARAELAGAPGDPAITGIVFFDENFNGRFDDFEMPHGRGAVYTAASDGTQLIAPVGSDGRYRFPISRSGLYELYYDDFTDGPWCISTPNPLVVVVAPGPEGEPQSYENADFGWSPRCGPTLNSVIYTDRPLSEFAGDRYSLLEATADGNELVVRVGLSACHGDHPITLVVSTSILKTLPPQTFAVLMHDNLGDVCRSWREEERRYDLSRFVRHVGGPIYIRLLDYEGMEHSVLVGREKQDG